MPHYVQRDAALADGFGYDLNDQATSFRRDGTLSGSTVSGGTLSTLNFDASGNRTSVVTGGTTTTYLAANNLNQYPTIGGAGATYDANGNLYTYNGWTYTYDSMNRLTLASGPGTTANFYYDGLNRQVARTITGSTTKFSVWDGWNLYAEYSPANVISERLVYGAGGDLVKSLTNSRNYYSDGLGSTTHVATAVGGLLESYTYDLNGTPTFYNAAGTVLPGGTAYGINRLYTGQQWHSQLGLYDNRNRFLLPSLGRFLQPDPIGFAGDSANMYRYCGNNPVNWSDPWGLDVTIGWYDIGNQALGHWGHIGLGVNSTSTQGFDSVNGSFSGPGSLHPDTARLRESITIPTTPAQDAIIAKTFASFDGTHYNLLNRNCSVAVSTALAAAGLNFDSSIRPNVLFNNLKKVNSGNVPPKNGSNKSRGGGGGYPSGGSGLPGAGGALPGSLGGATAGTGSGGNDGGDSTGSAGGGPSGSSGAPNPYIPSVVAEDGDGKQTNIPYDDH